MADQTSKVSVELPSQPPRDQLSERRTLLAAERTYAAWIRTALAALVSGVGSHALLEGVLSKWLAVLAGSMLVLFAGFCLVIAVYPGFDDQVPPVGRDKTRIPYPVLVGVNIMLLLLTAAVLIGMWTV